MSSFYYTTIDPILSLNSSLEYKRQNLWYIVFDNIPSWICFSAERPKITLGNTRKIKYINTCEKLQQGYGEWQPITITLNDPVVPSASKYLIDKLSKQYDFLTGKVGYKADYVMQDMELRLMDGNGAVVETWVLHEPFLTNEVDFNPASLSYDESNQLKVKFTLEYTYAEHFDGFIPEDDFSINYKGQLHNII